MSPDFNFLARLNKNRTMFAKPFPSANVVTARTVATPTVAATNVDAPPAPPDPDVVGPQGPQGLQGPTGGGSGASGPQGPTGNTGPQGIAGDSGAAGPAGPQGPQGQTALPGSVGPQGPQGPAGTVGLAGPQGPQGSTGATGDSGPQGPQGNVGPTGAGGPQGPQGSVGATGGSGPQGPQGNVGTTGPSGPAGSSNALIRDAYMWIPSTTLLNGGNGSPLWKLTPEFQIGSKVQRDAGDDTFFTITDTPGKHWKICGFAACNNFPPSGSASIGLTDSSNVPLLPGLGEGLMIPGKALTSSSSQAVAVAYVLIPGGGTQTVRLRTSGLPNVTTESTYITFENLD